MFQHTTRAACPIFCANSIPQTIPVLAVLFVLAMRPALTQATDVLNNGMANSISAASDDLQVRNGASPTTLNVLEGAQIGAVPEQDPPLPAEGRSIGLFDASVLNFSGGEVAGSVDVLDSSVANLSGGLIGDDLRVGGSGQVALSGTKVEDDVFQESGSFNMSGGEVGDQFFVSGNATLNLGEAAGPINDDLFIQDSAMLTMAGGTLGDELFVQGNARAVISGGYIDDDLNANNDAIIDVSFVEIDDSVDTTDNGAVRFGNGIVNGGFEAADTSSIDIEGGVFENILSDGEVVLAAGGTVNITGGTFGTAGVDDGGSIGSSLGGTVNLLGGQVAGVADGNAPTATLTAVLNGVTNLSGVAFGDLVLEAGNNGTLNATDFEASTVSARAVAGGVVRITGGQANELEIAPELGGEVVLEGGEFGSITISLESESQLAIVGDLFTVNGTPVGGLDAALGDADAFIEDTGELRLVAGEVEGVFVDGSPFSLSFTRAFVPGQSASVFLQTPVIPEPSSGGLAMLAIVTLLGLVRRLEV